jgi:1-acyl-sn-glycerol-3-phosphate acyltransferase
MLRLRSFIFILFMIFWTVLCGFLGIITFLSFNHRIISIVPFVWGKGTISAQNLICRIKVVVSGTENLPEKPFIVASKHQSVWETVFYLKFFRDPIFILKRELNYIPIYGWYLPLIGMISIDRSKKHSAIIEIKKGIKKAVMQRKTIIIFPEGTRVNPLQRIAYKSGIASIHKELPNLPIVPIALNSGTLWPKGSWLVRSGTIFVKILPAIRGNYDKNELLGKLQSIINEESDKLL